MIKSFISGYWGFTKFLFHPDVLCERIFIIRHMEKKSLKFPKVYLFLSFEVAYYK